MRAKSLIVGVVVALLLALPGPILAASSCSGDGAGANLSSGNGRPINFVPNGQGLGPWPLLL